MVKRYDVDGCAPWFEADDGGFVDYEDYAALEAKCAAMAAENAGLKDINSWCKTDAFKNMYREFKTAEAIGCHDVDCMHDAMLTAIMHAPKIPATDAFLAELRAQGVEMAACAIDDVNQFNYANMLDDLAQKIRQEAAQ